MTVPFSFGAATTAIPLSQLDSNFNTTITLGNTAIQLGNTVTTLNNMTLANVTISSGNVTLTNVTVTTANATTVNTTTLIATTANVTTINATDINVAANVTLNGGTVNGVAYLNGSKVLTTGSGLTFDGSTLTNTGAVKFGTGVATNTSRLMINNATNTATGIQLFQDGIESWIMGMPANSAGLAWSASGSEKLRLTATSLYTASGVDVGIGTSSPGSKLHIDGNFIRIEQSGANTAYFGNAADLISGGPAGLGIRFNGSALRIAYSNTQIAMFDSSGNLGLGVTPSAWGGRAFQIGNVSNSGWASIGYDANGKGFFATSAYNNTGSSWIYTATGFAATLYSADSGAHKFFTAPSGTAGNAITFTPAMTLDASGNLGLGTTNINQKFVVSNAGAEGLEIGPNIIGSAPALIAYNRSGGAYVQLTAAALRHVWQIGSTEAARISGTGYFKASNAGTYLSSTGDYHELRSSNDNYLLYAVNTRNGGGGPFGISVEYSAQDPNGTTNEFLQCVGISTLRAEIRSNGGIANYSANNVALSDRREKKDFAPAKSYLDTICAIPVQTFNYINQSEDDPGLTLGVVAQDVQAVAPELVMESNWGSKDDPKMRLGIYQTDLQYALMKALQELKAEFDAYKATHP